TLFLFTESDIASILGPTLSDLCLEVLVGPTSLKGFSMGCLWLELHLLAFEILGIDEDKLAKPHRPIVSGRISLENAEQLYRATMALALLYSMYLDLLPCSIIYIAAIVAYNEGRWAENWVMKSMLASIGYVCYCWGVTSIFDHGKSLSDVSRLAVLLSGALHATTGYAQDFRDREGDSAIGRKTIPILLPQYLARWSLLVTIFAWTGALVWLWRPPILVSVGLVASGVVSTVKFVCDYSLEADNNSYLWYNIWLITAHFLPLSAR
ncbi:UbiA prenyltransferase family-domain-containing protein, partial [Mycena floridula]